MRSGKPGIEGDVCFDRTFPALKRATEQNQAQQAVSNHLDEARAGQPCDRMDLFHKFLKNFRTYAVEGGGVLRTPKQTNNPSEMRNS